MQASRLLSAALLLGLAWVPPAAAQEGTNSCGDIELVFRNPDLQPGQDGFIRASGRLFVQFQAIGETADQITTFAFSFGPHTADFGEDMCALPAWVTGAYVPNYRADRDPSDGFFIGLNTTLVPDGTYAAAVHAYDADNNELARFWAKAVVDNCDAQPTPAQERCGDDAAQVVAHDVSAPWPIILPGDGTQIEGRDGLTIEFAEGISNLTVTVNNVDVTGQLEAFEGRLWDDDVVPDYGPQGVGNAVAPPCSQQPPQTCNTWGPAFLWRGALADDDVVRVVAADLAGNVATKDIHIGSAVAGGAITDLAPNLQVTVDETEKATRPGEAVVFRFDFVNTGGGTAHPFTSSSGPEGWETTFTPHAAVEPGESGVQELTVVPPASAAPGDYSVNASIKWQADGGEQQAAYGLTVTLPGDAAATGTTSPAGDGKGGGKDSPGVALPLLLAALGMAVVALRRRVG